jgi:hypothetical protein
MHDPRLKGRLHRIGSRRWCWGTADRLAGEAYGRAFCAAVPGGVFEPLAGAGTSLIEQRRFLRGRWRLPVRTHEGAEHMRVYQFTEQPYFPAWSAHDGSLRVGLPNSKRDPKVAADLLHRYYDEWRLADELGPTSWSTSTTRPRLVRRPRSWRSPCWRARPRHARLWCSFISIGHRPDPLRCAEELATIDVLSRGRLDMGFIKGVPYEFPVSNQNAVGVMERFWESTTSSSRR